MVIRRAVAAAAATTLVKVKCGQNGQKKETKVNCIGIFFRKKFITLNDGDGDDDGDDIIIIIGMAAVAVDACNILWQSQRPFRKTRRANETLAMQMSCGNL